MTSPRPTNTSSTMTPEARKDVRRRMMILFGSVLLVHGAVIAIFYGLHMPERPVKTQQMFIAVWVVLTMAVVVPQMKEIRKYRRPRR